jgi:hypothetical protein
MIQQWWNKSTRIGITPETSSLDAQYIIVTNFIALLGILLSLIGLPIGLLDRNYAAIPVNIFIQLLLAVTLFLNYKHAHGLAAFYICLITALGTVGQIINLQTDAGLHYWLMIIMTIPFLTFPAKHTWAATLTAGGIIALLLWVVEAFVNDPASKYAASIFYAQLSVGTGILLLSLYSRNVAINALNALNL